MGQTPRQLGSPHPLGKRQSISLLIAENAAEAARRLGDCPGGR